MNDDVQVQISHLFTFINDEIDSAIQNSMVLLAERISADVKAQPESESWNNQTGNLRSSIRAATFKKGKLVSIEEFVKLFDTANEAADKSKDCITRLADSCKEDYASVIVAAMEYAGYVEALDNKQVLAGVWAKYRPVINDLLAQSLEPAIRRINRRLNR